MRIYITHCSAKKNSQIKGTSKKVGPEDLYTALPTQRFIAICKKAKVNWAIFSDKYDVFFPNERNEWYNKHPNSVSQEEFNYLVSQFDKKMAAYNEIYFYRNPGRFHPLYQRLIDESSLNSRVILISHLWQIK
jgi:hypothetical protein